MFDPLVAVTRFGLGPSPRHRLPGTVRDMLNEAATDRFSKTNPFLTTERILDADQTYLAQRRIAAQNEGTKTGEAARDEMRRQARQTRTALVEDYRDLILRRIGTPYGLRERLAQFWEDHFTAVGRGAIWQFAGTAFASEAIRPHILGRFADMAKAVVRHPLMVLYLDQISSVGPNSRMGRRNPARGLNENLARELLELHTLGVGGPYDQSDVRELAKLLAGITVRNRDAQRGFVFAPRRAEPGAQVVLGRAYEGESMEAVDAAIEDLARHPTTAAHLARKIAVHFISDAPSERLIRHLTARYLDSDGDLGALTRGLLEHPDAWAPERRNVKWPLDYVTSAARAIGALPGNLERVGRPRLRSLLHDPLRTMGQPWMRAPDPAGWPEDDVAWVTPQAVAARVSWAMDAPSRLAPVLPDPRELLVLIAGPTPPPELVFAVGAAESQREGVGLVLASPAFQRS